MGKMHVDEGSKWIRFLSGKGFYVALAVCLLAVCGIAVATFLNALPSVNLTESSETTSENSSDDSAASAVGANTATSSAATTRATTTSATTATTTVATTEAVTTTAPTGDTTLFVLPLTNLVQKAFSSGEPVYSETMKDWRAHNGVDFVGQAGQQVKAAADGQVVYVANDALWGGRLLIDHGHGVYTLCCGVSTTLKAGDAVQAGKVIGTLGDIPCETEQGPHLHLEMTVDDNYVDPVEAIGVEVRSAESSS